MICAVYQKYMIDFDTLKDINSCLLYQLNDGLHAILLTINDDTVSFMLMRLL